MNKGIIIQARTGSSRLPDKVITPFYQNETILDLILASIKQYNTSDLVVLATTTNKRDDILAEVATKWQIKCYRGSENDVLDRFISAADHFGLDCLIRICSDNPFLRTSAIKTLFDTYERTKADYISFAFPDGLPVIKSHLGLFMELAKVDALKKVKKITNDSLYHEHVTNYLYTHPELFKIKLLSLPENLQYRKDLRFTLDTKEDFVMLQSLYADFKRMNGASIEDLLNIVDASDSYQQVMKLAILSNQK